MLMDMFHNVMRIVVVDLSASPTRVCYVRIKVRMGRMCGFEVCDEIATTLTSLSRAACPYIPIESTILITLVVGVVSFCSGLLLSRAACHYACARLDEKVKGSLKTFSYHSSGSRENRTGRCNS